MEPDLDELPLLLADLAEGQLDEAGWRRLTEMLGRSAEARRAYRLAMQIQALLERFDAAHLDRAPAPPETAAPLQSILSLINRPSSYALITATAVLFASLTFLRMLQWDAAGPAVEQAARPVDSAIAMLVGEADARWGLKSADAAGRLVPGRLELQAGASQIRLDNGVELLIEGPAHFDLQTLQQMRLDRGRMVVRVPKRAQGFRLLTPQAELIDLGTEFGVETDADHFRATVFTGRVEVRAKGQDASPRQLSAGETWEADSRDTRTVATPPQELLGLRAMRTVFEAPRGVRFKLSWLSPGSGDENLDSSGRYEAGANLGGNTPPITINEIKFLDAASAAACQGVTIASNVRSKGGVQGEVNPTASWRGNLARLMETGDGSPFGGEFDITVGGLVVGRKYCVLLLCAHAIGETSKRVMHIASGNHKSPTFDASGARVDLCPLYIVKAHFTACEATQVFTARGEGASRAVVSGVAVFSLPDR